jgi:hypothetical protein
VISIFFSKSKYFKTSSIKDLISSTERIEGVPPKYKEESVLFSNSSFLRKISFLLQNHFFFQLQRSRKMKVAVAAFLFAKRNVKVKQFC